MLHKPLEEFITQAVEQLQARKQNIVLILDDYHVITNQAIHDTLTYWLQVLPHHVHLVLISRHMPVLPISRLRVAGQLLEITLHDLQFQYDEVEQLFNQQQLLALPSSAIDLLVRRTEGWITGMKLAALTMPGRGDTTEFVHAVSGSQRYIMDFLAEEVLQRQPAHVQAFSTLNLHSGANKWSLMRPLDEECGWQ